MDTTTETTLLEGFATSTLPAFTHRDHVHVAWLLLGRHPLAEALAHMDRGIRGLAKARGLPDLYHATVTWAFVFLVNARRSEGPGDETFEQFERRCPELFGGWRELLNGLYGMDVMQSARAKESFLMPEPVGRR